jgi:hypothetical protein
MRSLLISESGERFPMSDINSLVLRSKCVLVLEKIFALLSSVYFRYVPSVVACTFSALSLFYCRYIFGTLSALLAVHFRYAFCVTAFTFSVRSLLLLVLFRYAVCVNACTFSVRCLCYCLCIFGTVCVTACTFSVRSLFYCRHIFGTFSVFLPVHFR